VAGAEAPSVLMCKGKINISKLKQFALESLRPNSVLRDILLSQDDELEIQIFLARLPLFLELSKVQKER
jgi:hypothetical protein